MLRIRKKQLKFLGKIMRKEDLKKLKLIFKAMKVKEKQLVTWLTKLCKWTEQKLGGWIRGKHCFELPRIKSCDLSQPERTPHIKEVPILSCPIVLNSLLLHKKIRQQYWSVGSACELKLYIFSYNLQMCLEIIIYLSS